MLEKPSASAHSGVYEPWLNQLVYTELPGSNDHISARHNDTAATHSLDIFPVDGQTLSDRLGESNTEKGMHELM